MVVANPDGSNAVTVRGKAANGAGSVYFDKADDVWRATYVVPTAVGPARRKVRGSTREEALRRASEAYDRAMSLLERQFDSTITLAELSAWWIDNIDRSRVRRSSIDTMSKRITPGKLRNLAGLPVTKITASALTTWRNSLLNGDLPTHKPLAASTVSDIMVTVGNVLDTAVDNELIPKNPMAKVKPPKVGDEKGRSLPLDEVQRLCRAADGIRLGPPIRMLFLLGWRASEVLGLAWQDIDFTTGTATVSRAFTSVGSTAALGPAKTKGTNGVFPLPKAALDTLQRWRAVQNAERLALGAYWPTMTYRPPDKSGRPGKPIELDMVFTRPDGTPTTRQQLDKALRALARSVGIDSTKLGTHVGRRSLITLMHESGQTLEDIAEHTGHTSTETTAIYVTGRGERPAAFSKAIDELYQLG
jgi:integrase